MDEQHSTILFRRYKTSIRTEEDDADAGSDSDTDPAVVAIADDDDNIDGDHNQSMCQPGFKLLFECTSMSIRGKKYNRQGGTRDKSPKICPTDRLYPI